MPPGGHVLSVLIYGLISALPSFMGVFLMMVYTRAMSMEDYGAYSVLGALLFAFSYIADLGIAPALVRGYWTRRGDPEKASEYLASIMRGSNLLAAAILPFIGILALLAGTHAPVGATQWTATVLLLIVTAFFDRAMELQGSICRVYERADYYAIGKGVYGIVIMVAGPAIVGLLHGGVPGAVLALLVGRLVSVAVYRRVLQKKCQLRPGKVNWGELRECLAFGLPLIPNRLIGWMRIYSLKIVLAAAVSLSQAAVFSVVAAVATLPMIASTAVDLALTPLYFKRRTEQGDAYLNKIEKFAGIYLAAIFPVFVALILFSPQLIRIFAPERFSEAGPMCAIMLCSTFFRFQQPFVIRQIHYLKATWIIPLVTLWGPAATIGFTCLFASGLGLHAVILAILLSDALTFWALNLIVSRRERLAFPIAISSAMAAILTGIAFLLMYRQTASSISSFYSAKILTVLCTGWLCYRIWIRKEWSFIKQLVKG